jgi:predicted phage replisome organizer
VRRSFYWLKLRRDFFKRHDMEILESMPNGKDYVLFYLKLLVESIDHEGTLRFSDTIPYDEHMLATITRTNVDVVRSAVKVLAGLGMLERLDDGTLFLRQVQGMIGSETSDAIRKREYREKQVLIPQETGGHCPPLSQKRSPELELELEKELEKEKREGADKPPRATFKPPTIDEVRAYCEERGGRVDPVLWHDFYTGKGWMVGKNRMKDWQAAVRTWERGDRSPGKPAADTTTEDDVEAAFAAARRGA